MWMIELTTNTSTAESRIGIHNESSPVMATSLRWLWDLGGSVSQFADASRVIRARRTGCRGPPGSRHRGIPPLPHAAPARGRGHGLVFRAAVQIPILRDLNGFQTERPVVNVGVTYMLARR